MWTLSSPFIHSFIEEAVIKMIVLVLQLKKSNFFAYFGSEGYTVMLQIGEQGNVDAMF